MVYQLFLQGPSGRGGSARESAQTPLGREAWRGVAAPSSTEAELTRETRRGRDAESGGEEREREREIYIYIYICCEVIIWAKFGVLKGYYLGQARVIIWAKFVFAQ